MECARHHEGMVHPQSVGSSADQPLSLVEEEAEGVRAFYALLIICSIASPAEAPEEYTKASAYEVAYWDRQGGKP
jgi:hypothetical protein